METAHYRTWATKNRFDEELMKPFQTHILHIGRPKLLLTLSAVLLITGLAPASQSDSKRESDRLALKKVTKDMIEAFDKRDAAAIAAHWIDEGEFIHNDDEPIRGQARSREVTWSFSRLSTATRSCRSNRMSSAFRPRTWP